MEDDERMGIPQVEIYLLFVKIDANLINLKDISNNHGGA